MRSKNTDLMNEIKKFAEEYYLEYWKSPSTSEIAGAVGVTRATVYRYLKDMAEREEMLTYAKFVGNSKGEIETAV